MMFWLLSLLVPTIAPTTPSGTSEAANGLFKAVMIAVPDLEQFDRQWGVKTEGAEITSTTKLVRGKPTYFVVILGGCRAANDGKCRIEVRPKVTAPDGTAYDGLDGSKALPAQDMPVTRPDAFFLAPQLLGIEIESGEALGPYRVEMTISDQLGNHGVVVRQTLTAVETE